MYQNGRLDRRSVRQVTFGTIGGWVNAYDVAGTVEIETCVDAAVLTGGKSRRMGADKALLVVNGQTILQRTLDVLTTVAAHVTVVGDRPEYHGFGAPVVADRYPGTGALGGVVTALELARCDRVIVVACDMPFLSASVLSKMTQVTGDYDIVLPLTTHLNHAGAARSTYHPLHAVYSRRCVSELRHAVCDGRLRIADVLPTLRVRVLAEEWLREWDHGLASLTNVNTPEELAHALDQHGYV